MSIATVWYQRIAKTDPVLTAIALGIARQSAASPEFDFEAAITTKLNEWQVSPDCQQGRALRYAVIYNQETIAARSGERAGWPL